MVLSRQATRGARSQRIPDRAMRYLGTDAWRSASNVADVIKEINAGLISLKQQGRAVLTMRIQARTETDKRPSRHETKKPVRHHGRPKVRRGTITHPEGKAIMLMRCHIKESRVAQIALSKPELAQQTELFQTDLITIKTGLSGGGAGVPAEELEICQRIYAFGHACVALRNRLETRLRTIMRLARWVNRTGQSQSAPVVELLFERGK